MSKPIIDYQLMKRVQEAHEPLIEDDDAYEVWARGMTKREQIDYTRLSELCKNFTPNDFAVVAIIAVKKCPQVVLKAILDELTEGDKQ